MKRIHLFEFEDLNWFPNWLRIRMTRLIIVMHRLMNSAEELASLLDGVLKETKSSQIVDLCSGSGGPMPEVIRILDLEYGRKDIQLTLTDLYPNLEAAKKFNGQEDNIAYRTTSLDATNVGKELNGLRTMICGFHHMKPDMARKILESAQKDRQPICIFEISDNSAPAFLWWIAFPFNILTCLLVTPMARPMSWQQLFFTYLIPIIPICFAWDSAVSNARTYTLKDMDQLLEGLHSETYKWEKGVIKGKTKKIYLMGMPS